MFSMGQDQSEGMELEDEVVKSTLRRYEDHAGPADLYEFSLQHIEPKIFESAIFVNCFDNDNITATNVPYFL